MWVPHTRGSSFKLAKNGHLAICFVSSSPAFAFSSSAFTNDRPTKRPYDRTIRLLPSHETRSSTTSTESTKYELFFQRITNKPVRQPGRYSASHSGPEANQEKEKKQQQQLFSPSRPAFFLSFFSSFGSFPVFCAVVRASRFSCLLCWLGCWSQW